MKKIFLLDAYALIYRAYYAFIKNPRINSKGINTSAIFGFFNTFLDVVQKEHPTHMLVAFDSSAKTFRHELYPAYKATREATPEDIKIAIPYVKNILDALDIPIYEVPGYEADDIIGTLAKYFSTRNYQVYLMTPDKDYFQLVDKNIYIYKPGRSGNDVEIIGINEIKQRYNLSSPRQFIDILGLWGDSSDNIPGAPGVGEKTAIKLIQEFGSIEALVQQIDKLKGKLKESILQNKDKIILSKKLVTIYTNVPLKVDEEQLELKKPNIEKIAPIFEELEFKTLLYRFKEWARNIYLAHGKTEMNIQEPNLFNQITEEAALPSIYNTIQDVEHSYVRLRTDEEIQQLITQIKETKYFVFDTETTSLDTIDPEIVGISFCFKEHEAYYLSLPINKEDTKNILTKLKPIFEDNNILKIAHNLKFDYQVLKSYGITLYPPIFDTMVAHYLLEPEQRHNMDYLSKAYLNYNPISIESLIGNKKSQQINLRLVDVEKVKEYCCEDSDVTLQLYNIFKNKIIEQNLEYLFYQVELPLIITLAEIELTGVKINENILYELSKQYQNDLKQVEQEIYQLSGEVFNINSPRQLGIILFEKLKLDPSAKKTKTQQYSTSEEELQKYIDKHPIVSKIFEYRSIQKLLNTYIENLPTLIHPRTKKVHTSFSQVTTATGRLSSLNPNLQNIPIRDERGKEIRKAFIPSDKYQYILSADYSQIELRIMAHLSNDQHLIEAFNNNLDIHTATAARIFNVSTDNVTRDMRSKAKVANFGIIYGISAFGLAQRLNISRKEAKELIDQYFEKYPGVKDYMNKQIEFASKNGYVETIFNRRRYLPNINSNNSVVRGYAERNAINTPIQGSAADIIKIAMNNIFNRFQKEKLQSRLLLQVHDELVFEVTEAELEKVQQIVKYEMESVCKLNVPLVVDIGYGKNWLEAH